MILFLGYKPYRLIDDSYNEKEVFFNKELNKEIALNDNFLLQIIYGESYKTMYMTEHEEKLIASTLQWLGTPVGVGFLKNCGFYCKDEIINKISKNF